jgi:thymidylate kinase
MIKEISEPIPRHQPMTANDSLVDALLGAFNKAEIIYSHWKSNIDLAAATAGDMDLDLLVERKSFLLATAILARLGFKEAVARRGANPPAIRHFYGLDSDSQQLIHVHLFSRVLTGESFVKSHLFPFEAMLLENVYYSGRMRVTSKPAELVLFTLRMFIKYGSLPDVLVLSHKTKHLRSEVEWLREDDSLEEAIVLLKKYCPVIDEHLFVRCVETLAGNRPLFMRIGLAIQVRRRLKVYAKQTFFPRLGAYFQFLWAESLRRVGTKQKNKVLKSGGAVIAFVGADATGKSTLVARTADWLGDVFALQVIHAGKPPSSWVTKPVNLMLVLLRRLIAWRRREAVDNQPLAEETRPTQHTFKGFSSVLYALRWVVLAWDRRRLVLKARRRAAAGEIIVCDRYPSVILGAMDSPRLVAELRKFGLLVEIYNALVRLEESLYKQIPPPDVALRLRVSLETAKKRNRERNGQDGEAYLEARHRQSQAWHVPGTNFIYDIDTEQSLTSTIHSVKTAVWESL